MAQPTLPPVYVNEGIFDEDPNAVSIGSPDANQDSGQTSLPPAGGGTVLPNPDVATARAAKFQQGKTLERKPSDLYDHIISGDEPYLRAEAAARQDAQNRIDQEQAIQNVAKKVQGPLGPDEVQQIRNILDPFNPKNTPADLNDVMEKAYSKDYVSTLMGTATDFMKENLVVKAQQDMPKQVDDTLIAGSELLTKNQYILTRAQNVKQLVDDQSYPAYGVDFAKTMFQPYVEYKLRNNVGEGALAGLGLGSNLDEAHSILYRLPLPEFKKRFDTAMDYLQKDNPQLAAQFAQAMLGQDTFESNLNNIFSSIALPDYLAIGKVGAKVAKSVGRFNQVQKATKDLVSAAAKDPTASPITRAEAVGDLADAAAQKVGKAINDAANGAGNPLEMAKDTLLSTWYDDAKKFVSNPGTYLGRELVTRTADGISRAGEDLYNRIATMNRVERTPEVISNPDSIKALQNLERQNYKGSANTFLDISEPIREPVSGTYWWKMKLGNYDATLFPDRETAEGFANQIGLATPIIKGTEAEKVYLPHTAVTKTEGVEFKTSKGSTYEVHSDGTTTRDKSYHPEHGAADQGAQPRSNFTGYITQEEYTAYSKAKKQGKVAQDLNGDTLRLFTDKDNYVHITAKTEPKVGLVPVEMLPGNQVHFGNPITEVGKKKSANISEIRQTGNAAKFFDADGVEILASPTPKSGHVPYNLKTGQFEKTLTDETAKVEQQGLGFYIEKWSPMKEDGDMVRDLLIRTTTGDFIPEAISNASSSTKQVIRSLLGSVRNSDDTLSVNESAQRKAVTYSQTNIHRWAQDLGKDIEDIMNGRVREDPVTGERLNRAMVYPKSWINRIKDREVAQQFERTLDYSRRAFDEDGNPGAFFKNPADLQDFYQRNFQRDPSYVETKAYFNFVKLIEGDRMMREVSEFRYRARLGTEQHSISYTDPKTGDKISSPFFDGITQKAFPGGDEQIMIVHGGKPPTVERLSNINTETLKKYKEAVLEGRAKAIMLYDRNQMPLSGWTDIAKDKLIRYVMVDRSESKPIEFNHVTRRGGGHFEWDYDFYLKQADVRKQNIGKGLEYAYVGDTTVMPIKNRKMGGDIVKMWNEAHEHIKNNAWDQVRPIVAKMGIKYDEFTGWYHPGRDANGNPTRPLLNAHEPIVVVDRNKKISEMDSNLQNRYRVPKSDGTGYTELFRDATKSGPENNFKVQYNQERNSSINTRTINDVGSQGNPIYAHQPADMIDPLTTMNRALNRVINSTFMDDYKIYTVEHWLREAAPYLNASEAELRSTPFAWFSKPEWRAAVKDSTAVSNLMSNRMKAQQFIGQPSKFDAWIHTLTSALEDSFHEFGPISNRNAYQKVATIVPIWMLNHVKDPVQFIRSTTFNFKLGLFAVPQFLVQAQTHSLIWALEPRHGTVGTYAMMLHGWGSFTTNPEVLNALDRYATKLSGFGSRFRPGEFLEARSELDKTGFAHVAGEYSNINNQLKTRFIMNDFEKGLKIGQYPFRLGEQSTRLTAWYTAFREFREANPNAVIGNIERSKILAKADLLTVNMSRASSSAINHGVFSLSTQFLSYQIKLAELFLGKRLGETTTERNLARARILTVFAGLYGLPNAIGVTGAPFSDNLKEHFMDDLGYIPGEKWWSTMINEGLPAWTMSMITGKLDNVGDRFGSQGFQNVKQGLRGDVPMAVALGGAGVSTGWNFAKAFADPYWQWYNSWMRGDNADSRFTITAGDLIKPWEQISSVSTGAKVWAAIQTSKWISRNEQNITDVTPLHAALLGATGMSPQDQDTLFTQNQMVKGEKDAKKAALSGFIMDWRRGIQTRANDEGQSIAYFKNAKARAITAGMDPSEINTAIAIATKAAGSNAIDDSDYKLWSEGDYSKRPKRLEQLRDKLKMKDNN